MINVIFMAKETYSSIYALNYLCELKEKVTVLAAVIRQEDINLKKICNDNSIKILKEEEIGQCYSIKSKEIDYIFSFYWKRVGENILSIPNKGSINFHPGPLPEARGSGYHIAILENWGYFGVTSHYMDEEFDTGAIIECRHFPIDSQIVNKDLVNITHEKLAILFKDTINQILEGKLLKGKKQSQGRYYSIKKIEESKLINDTDTEEEILRKIKAFWNPPYNGAQIIIKNKKYTVIDEDILKWISARISEK